MVKRATLLVLPTGCGKTICFGALVKRWQAGRVLVLAHREELITQAIDKIERMTGERPDMEMAGARADSGYLTGKAKCIVASKDSLHKKRIERFSRDEFGLIVTDEAHHAVAETYLRVYDYFGPAKHLGVTATPDRHDEAALGKVFESVAYVYEIEDAINDGWLVPIRQRFVEVVGLDYSGARTTAGDINIHDAEFALERHLKGIVDSIRTIADQRKCLVFATTVAQAQRMSDIFNEYEADSSRWVCGETPKDERRNTLASYADRQFRFLVNVGVLTEGYDDPTTEIVAMARPTKSRALYAQMAGRGTRPLPGLVDGEPDGERRKAAIASSGKPSLEIIDFAGNSGRHKLVTAADILGGKVSDEVIERANRNIRKSGRDTDALEEIAKAEAELHAEREAARPRAIYTSQDISPFDELAIEPPRRRGWDSRTPLTEKQHDVLRGAGIAIQADMPRAEASRLISEIIRRRANGLCTYKQAKLLRKFGWGDAATQMGFAQASKILDGEIGRSKKRSLAIG